MTMPADKVLEALRASLKETERLRQRNRQLTQASSEPVAIVGMGCRLPGGADSPDSLWELLDSGGDAISGFPSDRGWDTDGPTAYVQAGGFVYDAPEFDAGFFGISPREALAMDPQQRLLLEVSWEALERSGIDPRRLRGSRTGVFAGATYSGYGAGGVGEGAEGYLLTGGLTAVISGRVSYVLGLEGPAMTIDTACSSALVALHVACQALRAGECTLALAGGVTVLATPGAFSEFSRQQGLAADGRCKAFSATADGIGWAEGAAMLVLERLSDAQRAGHPVLAVIRGSAVNQDGASNGLTAPNGPSQQRVIRAALASARLSADQVDAVEAHGTGTTLGDPIEAQALLATYGRDRPEGQPLWLGSVKSNLGHTGAAAGAAGVMKVVLAIQHGVLPRTLHADEPSPNVDWSAGDVRLLTEPVPWPANGRPRRAGISAFGISGTNAHVIVEEPAAAGTGEAGEPPADGDAPPPVLAGSTALADPAVAWLVSGRSAAGLAAQAGRLTEWAGSRPGLDPADVAWSLATTRSAFEHRAVVVGANRADLAAGLSALAAGQPSAGVVCGTVMPGGAGQTVFVFPGQGGQWAGMGRDLAAASPVFATRLAECSAALEPFTGWPVRDVLADGSAMERVDVVQPVLWAVMVSLAAVWEAAGVLPDAVAGHSQGEIAAATVAGILSLADAAKVVALRSRALVALAGRGGMASVAASAEVMRDRLAAWDGRLSVAAVNGPDATVVSGDPDAIAALVEAFTAEGVRARVLPVDYASHSPQVEALEAEILAALDGITPGAARVPMVSAMTGGWLEGPELDAGYWYRSLRAPVEFARSVRVLAESGHRVFIETSPHPVLAAGISATLQDGGVVTGTLRRDDGGTGRLLASLAQAYVAGVPVDWTAVIPSARRVELPTYPFSRQRYWPAGPVGAGMAANAIAVGGDGAGTGAEARFWAAVDSGDIEALSRALDVDRRQPFSEVLPVLASWRRRERGGLALADWRYRVAWVPVPDPRAATLAGPWLLLGPAGAAGDGFGSWCAAALAARGADVICIRLGPGEAGRPDLAGRLRAAAGGEPAGVVSLLALDEAPEPGFPAVPAGLAATLALVQALGDAAVDAPLWVLTAGAVGAVPAEAPASPVQAQSWGLGRVAGLEHPGRWGGLIDLPARLDDRAAGRLCGLLAGTGEDQLAIRPAGIFARRLVRAAPRSGDSEPWTARGTALVTGAGGAIGPDLAGWLSRSGAPHLVLAGRRGPATPGTAALAAALAQSGTGVTMAACDIADRSAVGGLLAWIQATCPPLTTVIHAAVGVDLRPLADTGLPELDIALAAKTAGAAHLDELTAGLGLEEFVLFSSITATWGVREHGTYAAANAYLDALAESRRARGLPATSVAWGVWDAGGRFDPSLPAQRPQSLDPSRLRRQGLRLLDPGRALAALGQVLADDETFIAVADVDWERFAAVFTAARAWPLLDEIPEVRQLTAAARPVGQAAGGELASRLARLPDAERERTVCELVRSHAAAVLGHPSADAVGATRAFRDMGFDSLTAVELRDRLNTATGLTLPSTVVFDYPSPATLARQIVTELLGTSVNAPAVPVIAAAPGEPIAIVGLSSRFPGAGSPDELWELLAAGTDAIGTFPADRGWDTVGLFDPDPDNPGTSYTSEGGFVAGAGEFDPGFFGISPREALAMDPQQRLLLEVAWEAVERTGIDPASLRGTPTGVFAGAAASGYAAGASGGLDGAEAHLITGNVTSVISGRVSYVLGLEGPAVTVDTACSSALVSVHLAAQALRSGECTLALAGGVMVIADPGEFVGFSRQRALAADGRCKAFSAAADGMGLAEGAGLIVLERLSDARRQGHPVLAVITGSAVNQDGASNGLTAPNGPSQQRVIRAALAAARLSPADVDAVEGHGTGTRLGDPIEAQALLATYGQGRPKGRPLWLGSVKSNIGHAQQAAGAAGLIKMVLALQHGMLPRTLYADEPSPHVDWSAGEVRLLAEPVPWPAGGTPRRAGISAFGISGTNAHVIIEDPPAGKDDDPADSGAENAPVGALPVLSGGSRAHAWLVSGKTAAGLAAQAGQLADFTAARQDLDAADVAWSLVTTRSLLEHRAVVIGAGRDELTEGLSALAAGQPAAAVVPGSVPPGGVGSVTFVFPGQGGQWLGMGRDLAAASPVFAARLAECSRALAPFTDWSVQDALADASALERVDVLQPVLWAVMVSLAAVWEAAGVTPDAVAGHSQGEIAAAVVAGILSLEDAARIVALRSRALVALAGLGGMSSVGEPAEVVRGRLAAWHGRLWVAAVNGPDATVVSGDPDAIAELVATCAADGVRARVLPVDYASHSPQVEALEAEITAALANLRPGQARIPMVSAVTGEFLDGPELDAGYWYTSLRAPVEFARSVRTLADAGHRVFVEVSPHPVLTAAITATVDEAGEIATVTGTLRRQDGGPARLLVSLAAVHTAGVPVNWTKVLPAARRVELPTYAFQRQHYWPRRPARAVTGGAGAARDGAGPDAAGTGAEARFWAAIDRGDLQELAGALDVERTRLAELAPALASWRRRERADAAVAGWRYQVTWVPVADPRRVRLSGTWLLVVPQGNAPADVYAQAIAAHGAGVIPVEVGPAQADRAALADLLSGVTRDKPLSGVVSLLALNETPFPGFPVVSAGLAGTAALVQALGDTAITAPLWVVTCGAVAAAAGDVLASPVQAQVWGLGRVAALEYPERWGGLIDVPAVLDERSAGRVCGVLAGCGEDQAAVRAASILGRRMVRAGRPRAGRTWVPSGTVLVTGGTGAVGGHVARWLASRHAPRLILASRSGPAAPGAAALAAEVAGAGTPVTVTACDSASRDQVAGVLAGAAADGYPVRAVFHAAGVGQGGTVDTLTAHDLAGALAAKAGGAAYLDELTADAPLDALVLFSSGSATWGSALVGGYAAANAYLDALASSRVSRGLAATSVAWGLWGGGGMGGGGARHQLARLGLREMDAGLAVAALAQVLDAGEDQVTVADIDWDRFAPVFTLRRPSPLLSLLPEAARALTAATHPGDAASQAAGGLARRLAGLSRADQDRVLTDEIRAHVAAVLGHSSPEAVAPDRAFGELGFDSVTAVELRNRLGAATGLTFPATLVFDYPSPAVLARQLATWLGASAQPSGPDGVRTGDDDRGGARYVAVGDAPSGSSLTDLYLHAARTGRTAESVRLVAGLAALRPVFTGVSDIRNMPRPVTAARGTVSPSIICLPSFIGKSGIGEYARFSYEFQGIREVSIIPEPGFIGGEPLPATIDALVSVHAEIIQRFSDGRPFALAGHSSGGMAAHALATHLEAVGRAPAAVVLIDTGLPGARLSDEHWSALLNGALANVIGEPGDDAWLTAMLHYFSLGWTELDKTSIPTLQLRATENIDGAHQGDSTGIPPWLFSSSVTVVDVPGDHFTMLGEHARTTAQAVNQWLTELQVGGSATELFPS